MVYIRSGNDSANDNTLNIEDFVAPVKTSTPLPSAHPVEKADIFNQNTTPSVYTEDMSRMKVYILYYKIN